MDQPNQDTFEQRLRDLEKEHAKAVRFRDKWAQKATDLETKLAAFRVVGVELGLGGIEGTPASEDATAEGLSDALRSILVEEFNPGDIVSPSDLREHLGPDLRQALTTSITKAMVRMTEGRDRLMELVEKGRGKRQSRYRILGDLEDTTLEEAKSQLEEAQQKLDEEMATIARRAAMTAT